MAHELTLEKTQFQIEEILKAEGDTDLILDHETMTEDGWQVKITIPEDAIVYANTKWFKVSLVTGEDLIPPHTNPSELCTNVNIGPKGAPHYVSPPVTGYQSMTAMAMLSVLRAKLTLCAGLHNLQCKIGGHSSLSRVRRDAKEHWLAKCARIARQPFALEDLHGDELLDRESLRRH